MSLQHERMCAVLLIRFLGINSAKFTIFHVLLELFTYVTLAFIYALTYSGHKYMLSGSSVQGNMWDSF